MQTHINAEIQDANNNNRLHKQKQMLDMLTWQEKFFDATNNNNNIDYRYLLVLQFVIGPYYLRIGLLHIFQIFR